MSKGADRTVKIQARATCFTARSHGVADGLDDGLGTERTAPGNGRYQSRRPVRQWPGHVHRSGCVGLGRCLAHRCVKPPTAAWPSPAHHRQHGVKHGPSQPRCAFSSSPYYLAAQGVSPPLFHPWAEPADLVVEEVRRARPCRNQRHAAAGRRFPVFRSSGLQTFRSPARQPAGPLIRSWLCRMSLVILRACASMRIWPALSRAAAWSFRSGKARAPAGCSSQRWPKVMLSVSEAFRSGGLFFGVLVTVATPAKPRVPPAVAADRCGPRCAVRAGLAIQRASSCMSATNSRLLQVAPVQGEAGAARSTLFIRLSIGLAPGSRRGGQKRTAMANGVALEKGQTAVIARQFTGRRLACPQLFITGCRRKRLSASAAHVPSTPSSGTTTKPSAPTPA